MKLFGLLLSLVLVCGAASGQALNCNLQGYKSLDGLKAEASGAALVFTWQGESGEQLRATFTIQGGSPIIKELAAQKSGGAWVILGRDLVPEFQVTSGKRRMETSQVEGLQKLYGQNPITAELVDKMKWTTFWDAPLDVRTNARGVGPGGGAGGGAGAGARPGAGAGAPAGGEGGGGGRIPSGIRGLTDLPRDPSEVKHGSSSYQSNSCRVATEGTRESVTFDGLALGIFAGDLQFTVYKGSNLLRQEAVAKTEEPDIAYIYKAGLKGFAIGNDTHLIWRDTARAWQQYNFGGEPNTQPVNLRARNRLEVLEAGGGSLAVFPPPHKFFFARENEVNLGYVYYRKDNSTSFALGAMQPEMGEGYHPWGASDEEWKRRTSTAESEWDNFALYNAPPGTVQHMAVYYYLSAEKARKTQEMVMAYTHDDVFKPVPGFKVMTGHFHLDFNEMLRDRDNVDYQPTWVAVFRGLGINIAYLGDFHDDSHGADPGPLRFAEEKVYFEGARRVSDKDFLVMPTEEPNAYLGGHWWLMTPKPIYFSHATPRPANQQFVENDPTYGKVYHLGSSDDVLKMVNEEQGIFWTTHPRTKSSGGYPDLYKDKDFFLSDRFIGASWESLPVDQSEKTLCETRCFGTGDDMSNWAPKAKFLIAEGDTYTKWPDDETYPQLTINYIKLDHVPMYNESWAPIVEGIRQGNFYGTTGEVLFHNWGVQGKGPKRTYTASIEYTYPLEFAELVWGDGTKIDRQIIKLTDTLPFGTKEFRIPFDATGKKWVRFAVWDSAGNGAFVQPINLNDAASSTMSGGGGGAQ